MSWLLTQESVVETSAIDEYGHVNFLQYQKWADDSTSVIWKNANGGRSLDERDGLEFVLLETHVRYLKELVIGDKFSTLSTTVSFDSKRFHLLHRVVSNQEDICLIEILGLGFNLKNRRASLFSSEILEWFSSNATLATEDRDRYVKFDGIRLIKNLA